jgi:hypothetical protein
MGTGFSRHEVWLFVDGQQLYFPGTSQQPFLLTFAQSPNLSQIFTGLLHSVPFRFIRSYKILHTIGNVNEVFRVQEVHIEDMDALYLIMSQHLLQGVSDDDNISSLVLGTPMYPMGQNGIIFRSSGNPIPDRFIKTKERPESAARHMEVPPGEIWKPQIHEYVQIGWVQYRFIDIIKE